MHQSITLDSKYFRVKKKQKKKIKICYFKICLYMLSWKLCFFSRIIGLYLSVVIVIGRVIRVQTTGMTQSIMFNFLPSVDRMWKLVRELYLVREAREFRMEEELFARLMFLYRSPETLIKVTKYQFKEKTE